MFFFCAKNEKYKLSNICFRMSKRHRYDKYEDFCPTVVMKRHCLLQKPEPRGYKRVRDDNEDYMASKKTRSDPLLEGSVTLKRDNTHLNIEDHFRKKMRYSKPSVEEAIAYLLPHIHELRSLYHNEVEINSAKTAHILESHKLLKHEMESKNQLSRNNAIILKGYNNVVSQNNQLRRELNLIKYRLNLM